jgi:hypothetical protein
MQASGRPPQPPNRATKIIVAKGVRNSLATMGGATSATALQQRCNKAQQPRNNVIFGPRNSATTPYRGVLLLRRPPLAG